MNDSTDSFEALVLPHLGSAYNLARWLVRDDHAAEDVVQEAFLRALRYFGSFRVDDRDSARPWLLGIVRNACFAWLADNRGAPTAPFDDALELADHAAGAESPLGPEDLAALHERKGRVDAAISALPAAYREVLILRELEDLRYDEIARVSGIPIGTVMSRLSRARALLRVALAGERDDMPAADKPRARLAPASATASVIADPVGSRVALARGAGAGHERGEADGRT